jgi:hypothetical protein
MHQSVVQDDDELVALCVDEFQGLKKTFEQSGLRVKHLRSYSEESLIRYVRSHGGPDGLVPPWLDANNLRSLLRIDQIPNVGGKSVRLGQPPIDVGSISSSSASVPSNHAPATVELDDSGFALFESDGCPRKGVHQVLWSLFANDQNEYFEWSSEHDICGFVTLFLKEVARELDLPLKFRTEVGFFSLRPDITVVKALGIPVGVIEVKRPTKGILDNQAVLGELYDYMKQVVNFYGLKQVFGILTTYQEWRVCWMTDDHSIRLAGIAPVEEEVKTEPRTPPVKGFKGREKTSPPGLTPSKTMEGGHGLDKMEEESGSPATIEKDDTARRMMSTRVWNVDENVFNVVGSALWKMSAAETDQTKVGPGQMVIQVTQSSFFWCKRPVATFVDRLQWTKVPRAKNLLLLEDLGVGHSGRVWLVCSASGLVGVLKFSVAEPPNGWLGDLQTTRNFQKEKLETELKWWKKIYPELGKMCRVQKFAGFWALLMPHLCSPKRNDVALQGVEDSLREHFVKHGLEHRDVAWRNIGFYKQNGKDWYVVYDLESVTANPSGDWVEEAINSLREKI